MKKQAHYNPNSKKWIISFVIMVIVSIGVVLGTIGITNAIDKKNNTPIDTGVTINMTTPLAVKDNEYNVTGVEKAFDTQGNFVAYIIKTSNIGYNAEVPIELETTITKDGKYVCGIDVIKQEETEYLGVRIQTDEFKNQFSGRKLPVASSNSIEKGSKVDILSKSTISSEAVINGVNNSSKYLQEFLAE